MDRITLSHLLSLSCSIVAKRVRRWWLQRRIDHLGYQIAFTQNNREQDFAVERFLQRKQAFLRSELNQLQ